MLATLGWTPCACPVGAGLSPWSVTKDSQLSKGLGLMQLTGCCVDECVVEVDVG